MSKTEWNLDNWDVKEGQESRMSDEQRKALTRSSRRSGGGLLEQKFPKVTIVLCVLVVVLGLAAWVYLLSDRGELTTLANDINDYGYYLKWDDLKVVTSVKDTTIRELLPDTDLSEIIAISQKSSMPADVDVRGEVTVVVSELYNGDVITVYLLDGKRELGFVQVPSTGEIYELGGSTLHAQDTDDR